MILNKENCKQTGGFNLIEFNWICLPLLWQSGVNFNSGVLVSWEKSKKNIWVQDMPTKEALHGFECIHEDNLDQANPVPLASLSEEAQKYHRDHGNVFYVRDYELFASNEIKDRDEDGTSGNAIEAVANFGRGPLFPDFKPNSLHEKEEQDLYSLWLAETSWLVTDPINDETKNSLMSRHDLKNNVWFLNPYGPDDKNRNHKRTSTALISLRAEESLDRRVILSQGEYSTGQYSNNQGVNICSPVFDFATADIWRLLSATDWDVNDVYEKLYEIGVGIGDQRVGSLLNYAAVRQISTVKALESDLYGRINGRFQNVEFMAQFSKSNYFRVGKPKDTRWDGHNHIKAGWEPEEITILSDKYEELLKFIEAPYRREGNEFWSEDPKFKGKPWFPLDNYMKANPEMFE